MFGKPRGALEQGCVPIPGLLVLPVAAKVFDRSEFDPALQQQQPERAAQRIAGHAAFDWTRSVDARPDENRHSTHSQ